MSQKRDNTNFHTIIPEMEMFIEDSDQLGELVGYGSVRGFLQLEGITGSKFKEVKGVYRSLVSIGLEITKKDFYEVLRPLQKEVREIFNNLHVIKKDHLSTKFFDYIERKGGNKEEHICRSGSDLVRVVYETSPAYSTKSSLASDKQALMYAFTRKKGERR